MPTKQVFISGAMASHELDHDRESCRYAVNSLSPDFTAFGYEPFRKDRRPAPVDRQSRERGKVEIARSDALVLLVGKTVSGFCLQELKFGYQLGLPCRVFVRVGVPQDAKVRRFLSECPCEVAFYSDPDREFIDAVQAFCLSLLAASEEKQEVIAHTGNIWRGIIQELSRSPQKVFGLSPRQFEELLAEIIASFGYTTTLTPCTRDGGFDILAKRKDPLFPSLYLVEAKLWTPPRAVGRPVIQGIYGTGMAENCNGVMVVTPSMFSKDALTYLDDKRLKEYIRLVDGMELPRLYQHYLDGAFDL
jgi:hypothetical protein